MGKGAEDHQNILLLLTPRPASPFLSNTDKTQMPQEIQGRMNREQTYGF